MKAARHVRMTGAWGGKPQKSPLAAGLLKAYREASSVKNRRHLMDAHY